MIDDRELKVDVAVPEIQGPLSGFESKRGEILDGVVQKTLVDFNSADLNQIISEALYAERVRLRRNKPNIFTRTRFSGDRALWGEVRSHLLKSPGESDRQRTLRIILEHYAEEIGGHFDKRVYRFASRFLPFFFTWLMNAATYRKFNPWKMTESVNDRLKIYGEVEELRALSRKGTILLVPTHQSNIDSVLIGWVISMMGLPPFCYGAGLNLYSNPALSFFMSRLGAYSVDRQKNNAIYKTTLKNYSTRILSEGIHSIFFPGGGRSRSGAIESKLKLGLLGTALDAQIENLKQGKEKSSVYIVPMVLSYHFVLEASSLIEDFLAESGKARFIMMDDESWQVLRVVNFFRKFFIGGAGITVRIGKALDVFGNLVNPDGMSIGPNGTTIDPKSWLMTKGVLDHCPQRDMEYTAELGRSIAHRYHCDNTVLTSHCVAFALFRCLRRKYPDLDIYRFLRISPPQRTIAEADFMAELAALRESLIKMETLGQLHLEPKIRREVNEWVGNGIRQIGVYHEAEVIQRKDGQVWTDDMYLLYFYRNRLSGYGHTLADISGVSRAMGAIDDKGFLV